MQHAKIKYRSVSMKGNIAVNYYMLLSDEVLQDPNAYMQFIMPNGDVVKINVDQGNRVKLSDGETYSVFTCSVAAAEMTDDIKSQFFYTGGSSTENIYSVQTYAATILGSNKYDATSKALIEAMINYGAAAQKYFNYKVNDLVNDGLTTPNYSDVAIEGYERIPDQGTDLVVFRTASLLMQSEITLRLYFVMDDSVAEKFTVTYQGEKLKVGKKNGMYYVDVAGIVAAQLDEDVTVIIHDGVEEATVTYNPLTYCATILNSEGYSDTAKELVAALYLYNQAANKYFKEK
jgi:hypothetical protein